HFRIVADLATAGADFLFEDHEMFAVRIPAFDGRETDICAGRFAYWALCHDSRPPIRPRNGGTEMLSAGDANAAPQRQSFQSDRNCEIGTVSVDSRLRIA